MSTTIFSGIKGQYAVANLANDSYSAGLALVKAFNANTADERDDRLKDFLDSTAKIVSGVAEIKGLSLTWGFAGAYGTADGFANAVESFSADMAAGNRHLLPAACLIRWC